MLFKAFLLVMLNISLKIVLLSVNNAPTAFTIIHMDRVIKNITVTKLQVTQQTLLSHNHSVTLSGNYKTKARDFMQYCYTSNDII